MWYNHNDFHLGKGNILEGRWVKYKNGNYYVALNLDDGTKIRQTEDDEFDASRPESMDVKISNMCHRGCAFCHENSQPDGKIADLDFASAVVSTMPPYTEIAVGGGNLMENPEHTEAFLRMVKARKCVPSITLRQEDFIENIELVRAWREAELVYGIGVSLSDSSDPKLVECMKVFPTSVLHVIAGVFTKEDVDNLADKGLKMLILGYKDIRRGISYRSSHEELVDSNIKWLSDDLDRVMKSFKVLSFDNLALEQLPVRELVGEETWERFYMGDDGTATFYIDLVEREFARSSTSLDRHPILRQIDGKQMMTTVIGMFNKIKGDYLEEKDHV